MTVDELLVLIKARDDATRVFKTVRKNFSAFGKDMTRIGRDMSRKVTLPILAIGGAAVKMAVTFDEEMTKIITLVGVADDQVNEWRESLIALAPAVGVGPAELARAMFVVTSAGERGATALAVVEQAAKASAIGLGDTAITARAVTAAMQAYSNVNLTAARATEILVKTVELGNLEAADLAGTLGRVIGIASQVGVSFEEVGGFIATFTRLGVSAEESTTALRGILSTIIKPTKMTAEALESVGLSSEFLREAISEIGLAGTLRLLVDRFKDNTEALAMVIPNVRALSGVLGTAGAQGEEFSRIINELNTDLGFLEERFQRARLTPAQQWKEFKASVATLAIEIGNKLIPTFLSVMESVRTIVDRFTSMSDATQTTIIRVVGLVAAIGPLLVVLGNLIRLLGFTAGALAFGTKSLVAAAILARTVFINLRLIFMGAAGKLTILNASAIIFSGTIFAKVIPAIIAWTGVLGAAAAAYAWLYLESKKAMRALDDETATFIRIQGELTKTRKEIVALNKTNRAAWEAWKRIKDDLVAGGMEIDAAYIVALKRVKEEFGLVGGAAASAGSVIKKAFEDAVVPVVVTKKSIQEIGKEMKESFEIAQQMRTVFGASFDLTAEQVSIARAAVEDFILSGGDLNTVISESGYTVGQLFDWMKHLETGIKAAADEKARFNAVMSIGLGILSAIETPLEAYNRLLNEARVALAAMIIDEAEFARYTALLNKQLAAATKPAITEAARAGQQIGQALVGGVIRGMDSKDLWDQVLRIIEFFLIKAITGPAGLNIASASKVAIGWGQSIREGLVLGMAAGGPMIDLSVLMPAGGMSFGVPGGAAGGVGLGSAPVPSPAVPPVSGGTVIHKTYIINPRARTVGEARAEGREIVRMIQETD